MDYRLDIMGDSRNKQGNGSSVASKNAFCVVDKAAEEEAEVAKTVTPSLEKDTPNRPNNGMVNAEVKEVISDPANTPEDSLETSQPANVLANVEAPVIFVDPVGTRWSFPYENCRTWDGMKKLMRRVFIDCFLPDWYSEEIDAKDNSGFFSIIKLKPQASRISMSLWEQMVQPGWEVTIQFDGNPDVLLNDIRYKKKTAAAEKKPEDESSAESEHKPKVDILYVAELYQQDGSLFPHHIVDETSEKPLEIQNKRSSRENSSILQEKTKVYLGVSKQNQKKDESYGRKIDSGDIIGKRILQVSSEPLLDALKATIQFQNHEEEESEMPRFRVESNDTTDLESGTFVYPFRDLYHHKDELLAYKSKTDGPRSRHSDEYNNECDQHIDVLIQYLYDQPTIRLREAEALWSRKIPVTTFNQFWLLLKPGSDVYVRERGEVNAYVIETVRDKSSRMRARPFLVDVWNLDFDGKSLGRSVKTIVVPVFDGEREIRSLPLFPTRFYEGKDGQPSLRDLLIGRGKTFVNVVKTPSLQEYTGPSQLHGTRTFNRARVIIDHTTQPWEYEISTKHPKLHVPRQDDHEGLGSMTRIPECQCVVCAHLQTEAPIYRRLAFDDYDDIDFDGTNNLTEHQYFLCFSHVYGYVLTERFWDLLRVKSLEEPRIDKNIIDTLVMRPENNKNMVKAICETYNHREERENLFFADFVRGKGEGQIMLLHGPPGTGKTLTAESVAEYTRRPLLSITAADLGHEPEKLELNLLRFFRNANKWDAIVLLDEADVYLERRSANDLRRNSITSIFLRALDYFQGILFLTTNRIGSFDEAFMSRIHLQIGYEPLDDEARQHIWANCFKKLKTNHRHGGREIQCAVTAKEYVKASDTLRDIKWNGREICNAFQTAVALAAFDAKQDGEEIPKLTDDHLSQVVEMSLNFKKYMKSALQANDSDIAYRDKLRDDKFGLAHLKN